MQKLMSGFAAVALVFALPMAANAQEAASAETQDVCTATIAPISASANAAATATFTSPFGDVISIETPEGTGLALVTEEPTEMANVEADADADEAAPMADETENVSYFTLNAADVEPGTYEITLKNESGESCAAELTVQADELKSAEADELKSDENEDATDSDW